MSQQTQVQYPEGARRTLAILKSRKTILMSDVGHKRIYSIQGNGTYVSAAEQAKRDQEAGKEPAKAYFDRYIYNLKANSVEAVSRPATQSLFKQAIILEMKGEKEAADDLYNQFLNACQVSFNMIDNGRQRKFQNGDDVKVMVGTAETKAGLNAIVVSEPTVVEAAFGTSMNFDITDFVDEDTLNGIVTPEDVKKETPAPVTNTVTP